MKVSTVLRPLLFVAGALASYSQLGCTSRNECVVPTGNGTFCYSPNQSTRSREDSICRSGTLQNVMAVHISSFTSIGYYEKRTYARLGDWSYHVIRSVYVCFSGQLTDGTYQSMCDSVSADDKVPTGILGCAVAIGQPDVQDGCYAPDKSAAALQVAQSVGNINPANGGTTPPGSSPSNVPYINHGSNVPVLSKLSLVVVVGGLIVFVL